MKKSFYYLSALLIGLAVSFTSCDDDDDEVKPNQTEQGTGEDEPDQPGQEQGDYNGHAYVDLGLPSGLKWATCNVGADSPEQYGYHFAWGNVEKYSGNDLDWHYATH